ncbi:MAG: LacI family transcriptional regulator [Chloroflexota bacterium]|nr:LacI family transcriptional regulator [Chloroflexota bacterium]
MRVTIRDVAYRAGVSNNTVSRVLNDRPDVSPATRVRIQNVIEELGYRPNSLARSLLRRESRTVGLVVTDCTNPNTARQIRAVQQTMAAGEYAVLIFDTQEDAERQEDALRVLEEKVVDGIIITPATIRDDALTHLAQRLPVTLLNREMDGLTGCDVVLNDNLEGARVAVAHLIARGHTRIGYVTAMRDVSTVRDRLRGYQVALTDAGIPFDPLLVERGPITIEAAAAATLRLLEQQPAPTALFAYNDFMAVGILSALLDADRRVPDDVALVGYDDIVYTPYLRVPLTTIAQQTQEMGVTAARLLMERLAGSERPPQRVVFKPHLVVRASSGGPR